MANITISLRLRWWLRYYLYGVMLTAWMTGRQPDPEKLGYWVAKGVKVRMNHGSANP